jgi:hypothetical protein
MAQVALAPAWGFAEQRVGQSGFPLAELAEHRPGACEIPQGEVVLLRGIGGQVVTKLQELTRDSAKLFVILVNSDTAVSFSNEGDSAFHIYSEECPT